MPLAEWKDRKLRELVVENGLQTGPFGGQLHAHEYVAEGVPVVMPQDIYQGAISSEHVARITEAKAASLSQHRLRAGDLVFARRGDIGRVGLANESHTGWLCGTGCLRARLSKESLPEFVEKAVRTDQSIAWLNVHAVGQTMLNLSTATLGQLPLRMPPLPEQHRIAEVLNTIDNAIHKTEQLILKLKQLKQGLLHDLLTRGIDENGELRDPERHPEQFHDSPLGRIPKAWTVRLIAELAEVRSGTTPARKLTSRYFASIGYPWVKTLDLNEDWLSNTAEKVTNEALKETNLTLFSPGAVLVAMYGGWEQIGRTALLTIASATNQAISVLLLDGQLADPEFVLRALQHGRRRWAKFAASTRKDPNITKSDVMGFRLPVPLREEQIKIRSIFRAVIERIEAEERQHEKLKGLKLGLMEDLLTGRVRTISLDGAGS